MSRYGGTLFVLANLLSASCALCCQALASRACLLLPRLAASTLCLPLLPHQLLSANVTLLCELLPLPVLSIPPQPFSYGLQLCPAPLPSPAFPTAMSCSSPRKPPKPLYLPKKLFLSLEQCLPWQLVPTATRLEHTWRGRTFMWSSMGFTPRLRLTMEITAFRAEHLKAVLYIIFLLESFVLVAA